MPHNGDAALFAERYQLLRVLGRGGMGEVHLARDAKFDRLVAIKLFRDDHRLPGMAERFLKEAGIAGRLVHPHIVTVYDFGEHQGQLYMAMEYIAGNSLAGLIARRLPKALTEKVTLILDLCAGLSYAHDAGVLHRDIKPANLMLAPSGILKIVDFGIARTIESHTMTMPLTGSLPYMSPEQLAMEPLDARSDIFAVGAVLYELLTFRAAFAGDTIEAVAEKIRFGSPDPIATFSPDVPPALAAVVERALVKDREARFPDLHEMARDIRAAMQIPPGGFRLPEPAPVNDEGVQAIAPPTPHGFWARVQTRLLDPAAYVDYAVLALVGVAGTAASWLAGAHRDVIVPTDSPAFAACLSALGTTPIARGYLSRVNWWPLFIYLPLTLFVIRQTARRLFGMGAATTEYGILRRILPAARAAVGRRLMAAAVDPLNLKIVFSIAVLIDVIDIREIAAHYVAAARGGDASVCPRELDWTVFFVADPARVPLSANFMLVLTAYPAQFLLHGLALMLFALLLRHNLFYLDHIFQRHRAERYAPDEQLVLDFNDVERCLGLRVLHTTFNYQVLLLIVGGLILLGSRLMNVDATPLALHYEQLLAGLAGEAPTASTSLLPQSLTTGDLFPDAGQVMLGIGWLVCFCIVALPSAVKFLPLLYKHIRLVGRRDYLLEFIPVRTNVRTETQEQVDALAGKFARSAFWPAGDERGGTLYMLAFFVFFMLLVPAPPTSRTALAIHGMVLVAVSYICMRVTFWMFRRVLAIVDETLARE